MTDQWLFKSETYDNCNCAVNCGCQFNLPSTHGHCQSAFVGTLVEGHFNGTPLEGLNWCALYRWPGEIKDGDGKRQLVPLDSDSLAMLQYTAAGEGKNLMVYIHHTDSIREYAYDRSSHIGRLDRGLDEAMAKGWVVVDMKNDWKTIYPGN